MRLCVWSRRTVHKHYVCLLSKLLSKFINGSEGSGDVLFNVGYITAPLPSLSPHVQYWRNCREINLLPYTPFHIIYDDYNLVNIYLLYKYAH